MNVSSICYEATIIFLAQKIPNKFPNFLWVMPHIPKGSYRCKAAGDAAGGKGRRRATGGVAPDPELPPVSTRERSSAIRGASSSSSPELPSEWLPVLDMLAGARDWTDWGKRSVRERSEVS